MEESFPKAVTEQTYMYANYALVFYINPLPPRLVSNVCTVACDESCPLGGVMTESFMINILSMQRYADSVFVNIFLLHFIPNTPTCVLEMSIKYIHRCLAPGPLRGGGGDTSLGPPNF